jgi:hypothetical protein
MSKFYQDDEFEQFLQDEVKQHRMYPSDQIWKRIRTELHGYKAWPALTFISLFIITALTVSTLLSNHPAKRFALQIPVAEKPNNAAEPVSAEKYFQDIAPVQITEATFAGLDQAATGDDHPIRNNALDIAAVTVVSGADNRLSNTNTASLKLPVKAALPASFEPASLPLQQDEAESYTASAAATDGAENGYRPEEFRESTDQQLFPVTDTYIQEYGYVRVTPAKKNSKLGFQFYLTPSNSYRRLSDEKVKEVIQPATAAARSSIPLSSGSNADVNNVVRHKPALGFELGFAVLYRMNNALKFKTGVQLNVRQYYIETFQSYTNDLSSLSLINARGVETISFYSPYNNNAGFRKTQLDNRVYQLSVPVGVEWGIIRGKHFGLSTEASVQPTLTLNNDTYLLSTDYKHYTGGGEFFRKWNINTNVGINFSYTSGRNSWQIGPQIRYQHLPTYSNLYPIKEYLMDYGIRLAFTRQIK